MIRKIFYTLLFTAFFGAVFGQYQIPLYAPGNTGGQSSGQDNNMLSVVGQNASGLTMDSNNKVYLGLLAPVRYVLTDAEYTLAGNVQLFQNYPNPFKTETVIPFELSKQAEIKLKVFDILGQQIEVILDQEFPPGKHLVTFEAEKLKSGMFMYRLEVENFVATKTMVLTK